MSEDSSDQWTLYLLFAGFILMFGILYWDIVRQTDPQLEAATTIERNALDR